LDGAASEPDGATPGENFQKDTRMERHPGWKFKNWDRMGRHPDRMALHPSKVPGHPSWMEGHPELIFKKFVGCVSVPAEFPEARRP
jgi:hypothetical protein